MELGPGRTLGFLLARIIIEGRKIKWDGRLCSVCRSCRKVKGAPSEEVPFLFSVTARLPASLTARLGLPPALYGGHLCLMMPPPGSSQPKPPLPLLRLHRLLHLLRGPLLPRLHFTSASPSPQSSFILSPVAPPLFSTSFVAFIQFSFTTAGPQDWEMTLS